MFILLKKMTPPTTTTNNSRVKDKKMGMPFFLFFKKKYERMKVSRLSNGVKVILRLAKYASASKPPKYLNN